MLRISKNINYFINNLTIHILINSKATFIIHNLAYPFLL